MYHDISKIDAEIVRLKHKRKELILSNKVIKELGHVPRDYEELQMIYRTISKI